MKLVLVSFIVLCAEETGTEAESFLSWPEMVLHSDAVSGRWV